MEWGSALLCVFFEQITRQMLCQDTQVKTPVDRLLGSERGFKIEFAPSYLHDICTRVQVSDHGEQYTLQCPWSYSSNQHL